MLRNTPSEQVQAEPLSFALTVDCTVRKLTRLVGVRPFPISWLPARAGVTHGSQRLSFNNPRFQRLQKLSQNTSTSVSICTAVDEQCIDNVKQRQAPRHHFATLGFASLTDRQLLLDIKLTNQVRSKQHSTRTQNRHGQHGQTYDRRSGKSYRRSLAHPQKVGEQALNCCS